MRKLLLLMVLVVTAYTSFAQNMVAKSFRALPSDMTASSLTGKRIDQNGEVAALIKVVTPETGFTFEGGSLGIVDTKQENGEIWVWVPHGLRKITIKHQQLGVLRDYYFPIEIEAERTYEMVLVTGRVETVVKPAITQQYLAFQITPSNAVLEVDGELWEVGNDGSAIRFVKFGTYTYRVQAPNHHTEAGKVTVNDPDNTQKVTVVLKPDYVRVTLKVDANAEIWMNNEKKGIGSWTGTLGKGIYKVECKMAGHEDSETIVEVDETMEQQTITLPSPKPVYGSLNVESSPNFAKLFVDGKAMGETPKYIGEVMIGSYEIKLTKEGYVDYREKVTIEKGTPSRVQAKLIKRQEEPTVSSPIQPKGSQGAINGLFSVSASQRVYFSQGNLQYRASTNTWRFAEHQWDYIGDANGNISQSYSGWVDLFGWGTSGYNHGAVCYQPWSTSTTQSDYYAYGQSTYNIYDQTGKADWGYNAISNGGNTTNTWRTLTQVQWAYVFNSRNTSSGIRYAKAKVNNVSGVILLPDDWNTSYYPLSNTNSSDASYSSNTISSTQWTTLESHGAVFLPAAGCRSGTSVSGVGSHGYYWLASCNGSYYAWGVYFYDTRLGSGSLYNRNGGFSVRLVRFSQ